MKQDDLDELKRFIEATVTQGEQRLRDDLQAAISNTERRLREEATQNAKNEDHLHGWSRQLLASVAQALVDVMKEIEAVQETVTAQKDRRPNPKRKAP